MAEGERLVYDGEAWPSYEEALQQRDEAYRQLGQLVFDVAKLVDEREEAREAARELLKRALLQVEEGWARDQIRRQWVGKHPWLGVG